MRSESFLRCALSSVAHPHTGKRTHLITLCLGVRVVIEDHNPSFTADTVAEPEGLASRQFIYRQSSALTVLCTLCVCACTCVSVGLLESISICNDVNSIMLNVADRIKVVEADVSSIQNIRHKRQQCPLSLQKITFIKLKTAVALLSSGRAGCGGGTEQLLSFWQTES